MHRIKLDTAPPQVRQFLEDLPLDQGGVELELNGRVLYQVIPPHQLSDAQREAILAEGWELIRAAQERNKGVPANVIEREVREAVDEVRRRRHS
ncbi:MAG: hypothetical protein WD847_11495 [Pirellulales bacterium]